MKVTSPEVTGLVHVGLDGKAHLTPCQCGELFQRRMNPPTDSAMRLAVAMHAASEKLHGNFISLTQAKQQEMAHIIDNHLQLPEKHAALLLAQGIVDNTSSTAALRLVEGEQIDSLRTALSKIR